MTLAIEASPPRYGAAHCTFTDIEITCDLMDEDETPGVTFPPGELFGSILVELLDRYLISNGVEPS